MRADRGGAATGDGRGRQATTPTEIPPPGWKDILVRAKEEAKADNVPLLAAGVAFYALLSLIPALAAFVSIYSLVATPDDVARHVGDLLAAAPQEVRALVESQLRTMASANSTGASIGTILGIALALWTASSGTKHAIAAVNAAYDEPETRGFVKLRLLAIALTIGAIVFGLVAFLLVAILPAALAGTAVGTPARVAFAFLRWPLLAAGLLVSLAVFYRYAPNRDEAEWRWVSPGAIAATALWILGSIAFSIYTASFGSYNDTYGALGGVIVVMLWLFLTGFVVIGGAEVNVEIERQTRVDSTEGRPEPLGARQAYGADTVGGTAEEVEAREQRARARRRDVAPGRA